MVRDRPTQGAELMAQDAQPSQRLASRRSWLLRGLAAAGSLVVSGCARISNSERVSSILDWEQTWTRLAQRLVLGRGALAPQYTEQDISKEFRSNGTTDPDTDAYNALAANGFRDWRLEVGGLVERPLSLSLEDIRRLPSRSQITRHDCVEGWSYIAKWKGARLSALLAAAGLRPSARYIVFYCADALEITLDGTGQYYESIDLVDAMRPQTILAYEMNDHTLPIPYGAPLRLRLPLQLGYKMAKYIMRIDAVESFAGISRGHGGFWEDRGYAWYAGV
jgi:DMSO/TMAO reductase YedYZ molybdopterin-dependent catalytic subunit